MSNKNALQVIQGDIYALAPTFQQVLSDRAISFDREAEFALQILSSNNYLAGVASNNRQSLESSILNVAAIGITLNPARQLAYLVPRKGAICLDISYKGMIELAVSSGAVLWARADLVREADKFEIAGVDKAPRHDYSPFAKDRGPVVGCYAVAKLPNGDYMTETMTIEEAFDIRDRSEAWKKYLSDNSKKCPWVTDEGEMIRKTVIKRARKYWGSSPRLDKAIHHLNTDGEEGLESLVARPDVKFDLKGFCDRARQAKTLSELQAVWVSGVASAKDAGDKVGYNSFKANVVARKAEIENGVIDV